MEDLVENVPVEIVYLHDKGYTGYGTKLLENIQYQFTNRNDNWTDWIPMICIVVSILLVGSLLCLRQTNPGIFLGLGCLILFILFSLDTTIPYDTYIKNVADFLDTLNGRVLIIGHGPISGNVAAMLSSDPFYVNQKNIVSKTQNVIGCVAIDGYYSDKRMRDVHELHRYFGKRSHYYDRFPIYTVTRDTCPFLLIHTKKNDPHGFDFHYALKTAGTYVKSVYVEPQLDIAKELNTFINSCV